MTSSQVSRFRPRLLVWAQIEDLRQLEKYQIRTSLLEAVARSNSWSTIYKCSKCAAQSVIFSSWYWESLLIVLQILSTKAYDSLNFLTKKSLEFVLGDRNSGFAVNLLLMLLPSEQNLVLEKNGGKQYTILSFGINGCKIIFTLLAEVIALYIGFIIR